jgi:hypothetical protein
MNLVLARASGKLRMIGPTEKNRLTAGGTVTLSLHQWIADPPVKAADNRRWCLPPS